MSSDIIARSWNEELDKFIYFKNGKYYNNIEFTNTSNKKYFNWSSFDNFSGYKTRRGLLVFGNDIIKTKKYDTEGDPDYETHTLIEKCPKFFTPLDLEHEDGSMLYRSGITLSVVGNTYQGLFDDRI